MAKNKSAEELFQARDAALQQFKAVIAKAETEARDLTPEEEQAAESFKADATKLDADGRRVAKLDAWKAEADQLEAAAAAIPEPRTLGRKAITETVRESLADDPKLGFSGVGEQLQRIRAAYQSGGLDVDRRLRIGATISGMSTKVGADGGFAIAPAFAGGIWDKANTNAVGNLMSQTDNYTVDGKSLTFMANAETSEAVGSQYGGARAYWMEEGGSFTSSAPTLRELTLQPRKLGALLYMTSELMDQNSVALDQYASRAISSVIQRAANSAIFSGDGAGKPLGFLTAPGTVSVSKETGQAAATILVKNLDKMWARCHPNAQSGATWYINIDTTPQLNDLYRPTGTSGTLVYSPPGGVSGAPYGSIFGRPVVPIPFCSTLGTVGDIVLANLQWYATGTRGASRMDTSIHVQFLTDQTAFRFIFYIDGQPWLASAITPENGSGTLSPFVTLATRS